jgi:hypothetical protein
MITDPPRSRGYGELMITRAANGFIVDVPRLVDAPPPPHVFQSEESLIAWLRAWCAGDADGRASPRA